MLLDKRVYRDLEGKWVDLFNRLKWDTVKSALKSVAGLQGRKFKVRCTHLLPAAHLPALPSDGQAGCALQCTGSQLNIPTWSMPTSLPGNEEDAACTSLLGRVLPAVWNRALASVCEECVFAYRS